MKDCKIEFNWKLNKEDGDMRKELKIGDRVIVNGEWFDKSFNNLKGAVIDLSDSDYVGVEFDEYISGNSYYSGKPGHCVRVPAKMVKKEDTMKNIMELDEFEIDCLFKDKKHIYRFFKENEDTMKERIEALEKELAELKDQLNKKYEPMTGDWVVSGEGVVEKTKIPYNYKKFGRAFDTKEKAEKARNIMVRHDVILKYVIDHAPDFVPDSPYDMWSVWLSDEDNKWVSVMQDIGPDIGTIIMPEWVAKKLADDLNNGRIEL